MAIFWVARNDMIWSDYAVAKRRKDLKWCNSTRQWRCESRICEDDFESITGIKLKFGEGPVKIKIERID
jgi:hypothetical protein